MLCRLLLVVVTPAIEHSSRLLGCNLSRHEADALGRSRLGSSGLGRYSSPASELACFILDASRAKAELGKVLDRLRFRLLVIRIVSESGPTALVKRLRLLRLAFAEVDAGPTAHARGIHSPKPILIHTRARRVANRCVSSLALAAILEFGTLRRQVALHMAVTAVKVEEVGADDIAFRAGLVLHPVGIVAWLLGVMAYLAEGLASALTASIAVGVLVRVHVV
jgi:hypothetical protein